MDNEPEEGKVRAGITGLLVLGLLGISGLLFELDDIGGVTGQVTGVDKPSTGSGGVGCGGSGGGLTVRANLVGSAHQALSSFEIQLQGEPRVLNVGEGRALFGSILLNNEGLITTYQIAPSVETGPDSITGGKNLYYRAS